MNKQQKKNKKTPPAQGKRLSTPKGQIIVSLPKKNTSYSWRSGPLKKAKYVGGRTLSFNPWEMRYMRTLLDPFDQEFHGTKVPNYVPCNTNCRQVRGIVSLTSSASGNVRLLVTATPTCALISQEGTMTSVGGTMQQYNGTNDSIIEVATITNLQNAFTSLRVVSWGIRLRNNLNFSTVQGRVIIAPVIIPEWAIPGEPMIVQANTDGAASLDSLLNNAVANVVSNSIGSSAISLPGAEEMQVDQLINTDLLAAGRPVGPAAYAFRNTLNQTESDGTYFVVGRNSYATVAGGVVSNKALSDVQSLAADWCAYVVVLTGLPASSAALDLEFVYNLEGQATNLTANTAVTQVVTPMEHAISTATIEQIWQAVGTVGKAISFAKPIGMRIGKSLMQGMANMMK